MQRYTNTRPTPLYPDDNGEWCLWKDSQAINAELLAACKAKEELLICYRCGSRPTEKLFARLEKADAAIAKATESEGE